MNKLYNDVKYMLNSVVFSYFYFFLFLFFSLARNWQGIYHSALCSSSYYHILDKELRYGNIVE